MNRPLINVVLSGQELKRWYWLKRELVDYCKLINLNYSGSKFDILDKIAHALDEGRASLIPSKAINSKQAISKFDWQKEPLSIDTIITDSYKNSQNVRCFLRQHCGDNFRFSIPFMDYMKINCSKTLGDAINEWKRLYQISLDKNFKSEIPDGNQYNKYLRDFFADNPHSTIGEARHCWKLKRNLPLGRHKYEKSDFKLK
jgi:hypothetical protein